MNLRQCYQSASIGIKQKWLRGGQLLELDWDEMADQLDG